MSLEELLLGDSWSIACSKPTLQTPGDLAGEIVVNNQVTLETRQAQRALWEKLEALAEAHKEKRRKYQALQTQRRQGSMLQRPLEEKNGAK